MTTGPYTDIDFVLSGSDGRGDFIGISGSALHKAGIHITTCDPETGGAIIEGGCLRYGCIDPEASNWDPKATLQGTGEKACKYDGYGCTDSAACNYNPNATIGDGTCTYSPDGYWCEPNDCDGRIDPLRYVPQNTISKLGGTMLNVYNGPYQYPSWQQTRNLYNPVVRKLVENSILSLAKIPPVRVSSDGNQIRARHEGVFCFKEPVVSENAKPIQHVVAVQPNINNPTVTTSSFTYTYDNNLESFTSATVRNLLGTNIGNAESMYKNISQLYLDLEQVNANTNPVRDFLKLDYSQVLYPAPMNAFLNRTRSRTNYAEVAGTGSDGYDRIFGHQRTFFKEDQIRTYGIAPNSQGYIPQVLTGATDLTSSFSSDGEFPHLYFIKDASSGLVETADVPSPYANQQGPYCFVFGNVPVENPLEQLGTPIAVNERYLQFQDTVKNDPTINAIEFSFQVMRGLAGGAPVLGEPDSDHPLLVQYKTSTGSWTNFPSVVGDGGAISPASLSFMTFTDWTASVDLATEAPGEAALVRIGMTGPYSTIQFYEDNYAIQGLKLAADLHTSAPDSLNFNSMATDGIRSFPYTSSYRDYDGELMSDTDESMFGADPIPSLAFTEQLYLANESGSFSVYSDYMERLTEQISGRNPWYNTYEQYADDVRPKGKNMSILPEFKISDFISYYLIDQAANFQAPNNKFLSLPGASITSSAKTEDAGFNTDFGVRYVESSKPSRLGAITQEHGDIANVTRIELSCKGLKKLLPYNGFYPSDRTIQLGNLLSQSLAPYISGSYVGTTTPFPAQGLQGLLKPLMSPGILYNTIKSGIAVDYPIYTGSVPGFTLGTDAPADFIMTAPPTYRLPFESLLNLKGALPEGPSSPTRLVSSFATFDKSIDLTTLFKYYFTWNGDKTPLFELGMHNFLAETVDFFLEDEELTSYRSGPQPAEGWHFKTQTNGAPKDYYMDVVLRDTVEMNRFAEYFSRRDLIKQSIFEAEDAAIQDLPYEPGDFGTSVSMVSGALGDGFYALVGAPNKKNDNFPASGYGGNIGAAYLFQNKLNSLGWQQLEKFAVTDNPFGGTQFYGQSVSLVSSSDGLFIANGAPGADTPNDAGGLVDFIHWKSPGSYTSTIVTSSAGFQAGGYFGFSVDLSLGPDGVYMIVGSPLFQGNCTDPDGCEGAGGVWVYHSASTNDNWYLSSHQQYIDASTVGSSSVYLANFGNSVAIDAVGTKDYYAIIGAPGKGVSGDHRGWAVMLHSNSAGITPQFLTASFLPNSATWPRYGDAVDIVSGAEGVFSLVGAKYFDYGGGLEQGAGFLYHSQSDDLFGPSGTIAYESVLTASTTSHLGYSVSLVSGSSGGVTSLLGSNGKAILYESSSLGTDFFKVDAEMGPGTTTFGHSVSLVSSSNNLYACIGMDSGTLSVSGSGVSYFFHGQIHNMSNYLPLSSLEYDYKQHGKIFGLPLDTAYDPAYCAYTPPCFYGEAVARIKFSPVLEANYTLDEIFAQAEVENILTTDNDRMAIFDGVRETLSARQNAHKMPLTSSVNLFGKYFQPGVSYNAATGQGEDTTQDSTNQPVWVISTKFECPVLDVSSSKYNELYTAHNEQITGTYSFTAGSAIEYNKPRSMWTSYGEVPKNKGVYLEIRESFPAQLNSNVANIGSIIQACGFQPRVNERVGKVAQTKTISEAVVAIPYFENTVVQQRRVATNTTEEIVDEDLTTTLDAGGIPGKHFVKIHPDVFYRTKENIERFNKAVPADQNEYEPGKEIATTTVSNMIARMKKYVLPPNLDFVKYSNISPFVMYLFEFDHTLKQKELSDIWQGVAPDSALRMENDEVIISHQFGPFDFYGNMADRRMLGEMKFLVFKVKKRAKYNYYQTTKDSTDDARFNFVFQGNPITSAINVGGSYNWPYDFFSLVEKAEIETKLVMRKKPPPSPPPSPEENETEE